MKMSQGIIGLGLLANMVSHVAYSDTSRLTVLHTNDFHSQIEPVNSFGNSCKPEEIKENKCLGGVSRLASLIKSFKKKDSDSTLTLDAGDHFQGSIYYMMFKGSLNAELMNEIGYDAMAIGNHELDDGSDVLNQFIDAVNFPVLSANLMADPANPLRGKYSAFKVLEKSGQKIGVIGLLTPDARFGPKVESTLSFEDEELALRRTIAKLQDVGINRIVVLSHCGFNVDRMLAKKVEGIDLIISGHSHTLLSNSAKEASEKYPFVAGKKSAPTLIVSAGSMGKYLGKISIEFNSEGTIETWEGDTIKVDMSVDEDAEVASIVSKYSHTLEDKLNQVIGHNPQTLDGSRDLVRHQDAPIGHFIADTMLWLTRSRGTQIAFMNAGAIRHSLNEGEVKIRDILEVFPFSDTIATFRLKGSHVKEVLEHGVGLAEDPKNKGTGRFMQVAGLQFQVNLARPSGERISELLVRSSEGTFAPIDPNAYYQAAASTYVRQGGDGYTVFKDHAEDVYDFGEQFNAALIRYVEDRGVPTLKSETRIHLTK